MLQVFLVIALYSLVLQIAYKSVPLPSSAGEISKGKQKKKLFNNSGKEQFGQFFPSDKTYFWKYTDEAKCISYNVSWSDSFHKEFL